MQTISRKAAKAAGLKYYFTGKPCKRGGHIDQRYVASFCCRTCARDKANEQFRSLEGDAREARRNYERQRWRDAETRKRAQAYQREHGCAYRQKKKLAQPEYFKSHYAQHRDRRKQESRTWYHANADKAYANRKEYVAANRDKARAWGRKSRAKRRATLSHVFVEAVDPRVVFDRDKGVCGICGELVEMSSQWEVDHIIPIAKGGAHAYANVQLAHRKCNRSKGAKIA